VSVIASRHDFYRKLWQARTEWRSMDGFTDLLDCITDDRGLFFLSVCNKAVVPRWLYASYWWRHGVVLRTRISALGNACTDTVCIPNPSLFGSSSNINSYRRSRDCIRAAPLYGGRRIAGETVYTSIAIAAIAMT
jgi:hypothetical protein